MGLYAIGNELAWADFLCNRDFYTILEIKLIPRRKGFISNYGVLSYSTVKKGCSRTYNGVCIHEQPGGGKCVAEATDRDP